MESTGKYIIHYDDECSFCRQSAKIAGDFDKKKKFRFIPLQTEILNKPPESAETSDSVIFNKGNKKYYKSTAVLLIAKELGFPWSMLYFFILIPESFRDRLYDFVAGMRKRMK